MVDDNRHRRDQGLRRLARLNRGLAIGAVLLTGAFSEMAAQAFPGKTVKRTSPARSSTSGTAVSTQTKTSAQPTASATQSSQTTATQTTTSAQPQSSAPTTTTQAETTAQAAPVTQAPSPGRTESGTSAVPRATVSGGS